MKRGLVLGGGGLVGLAYHAGVLKALDDFGIDPSIAEITVGTSAGAVIGAYLGAGWTAGDFYDYAHGRHKFAAHDEHEQRREVRELFDPMWTNRSERIRRSMGSLFTLASARGFWKAGVPPPSLRRAFPSGMYSTKASQSRFARDLPEEWPRDGLYISAVDVYTGARVAFGSEGAPPATLREAVLASTAIPGLFPPVRIGNRHYVDGGIASASSLDLAADAGCETILCVAPLGYARDETPLLDAAMLGPVLLRRLFARSLRREVVAARTRGVHVMVIRPWLADLKAHGTNSMRHFDRAAMCELAREGTMKTLEANNGHPALEAMRAETTQTSAG